MNINWRARYLDGTSLDQYGPNGEVNGYENIDRTKLSAFEIFDADHPEPLIFRMFLEEGQTLIYRRRTWQDVNTGGDPLGKRFLYLVGWQKNVRGENVQSINYIHPDGHVEQAGKWVGGKPTLMPE